jgi:hypothetical protein
MTGYTPAEQAIRAARGLPYATGADDPPAWHDQPVYVFEGASDVGLPDGAVYGPPPAPAVTS